MSGLIVRDEDNAVVSVVAGIRAVWSPDHRQQHDERRGDVRASLAESMEHLSTTVPIALEALSSWPPTGVSTLLTEPWSSVVSERAYHRSKWRTARAVIGVDASRSSGWRFTPSSSPRRRSSITTCCAS